MSRLLFILLFVSLRMTDQDKEDFIRRTIHWQQNGLDLDNQNCLILNFGADLVLSYPQIRKFIFYDTQGRFEKKSIKKIGKFQLI